MVLLRNTSSCSFTPSVRPAKLTIYSACPRLPTSYRCANRSRQRRNQISIISCKSLGQSNEERNASEVVAIDPASLDTSADEPWRWEHSQNALQSYVVFFGLLALGQIPALKGIRFAELPYFVGLASLTIYIGAHRGLTNKMRQQISLKQGALAPLAASAALFGGFLLIKYLPGLNLQTACNIYFWVIGSAAVTGALGPPLRRAGGRLGEASIKIGVPNGWFLDESGESVKDLEFAPSDLLAAVVGLAAASLDFASGHHNYTFNNLIACLICCDILQLIGLRSFRTAAVLLFGLLAYDVFWVFGSPSVIGENVMLTVATSDILSGPTRLLFPRGAGSVGEAAAFPFSLLGLGDIAVPGLLACLALRFDSSKMRNLGGMNASAQAAASAFEDSFNPSKANSSTREKAHAAADAASDAYDKAADSSPPGATEGILQQRPYFVTTMVAYVGGLGLAFGVNAVTRLGQPALLYLVPCCLGSILLIAATKGDLGRVVNFTDALSIPLIPEAKNKE